LLLLMWLPALMAFGVRFSLLGHGLALIPLGAAAWLSHVNIFEKMFTPVTDARFAAADAADWVGKVDPVLAVEHGGDSAAYPVRQLAYHHIVQDVVGGVPVAVTY
jgi:hypothetical protein